MWDDWLMKPSQIIPRSTGSIGDDWLIKQCHIIAMSTGSMWDDWLMKHCKNLLEAAALFGMTG
jgi:hypothetical protein